MNAILTVGSLFDGLGGWQLAAVRAGIKPVWSSEIEPFPMSITKRHFPDTVQLGDITKIDGATIPAVDIICAGSPCQDLSIAGKREGLQGERSGLFRTAVDIVRRMGERSVKPRFFVWENVPGAFSSNHGLDFLRGGSLTLNIRESPSEERESSLSQILQNPDDVLEKYFLSRKACLGILRRAEARGKKLPPELKLALERRSALPETRLTASRRMAEIG